MLHDLQEKEVEHSQGRAYLYYASILTVVPLDVMTQIGGNYHPAVVSTRIRTRRFARQARLCLFRRCCRQDSPHQLNSLYHQSMPLLLSA